MEECVPCIKMWEMAWSNDGMAVTTPENCVCRHKKVRKIVDNCKNMTRCYKEKTKTKKQIRMGWESKDPFEWEDY